MDIREAKGKNLSQNKDLMDMYWGSRGEEGNV